MLNLATDDNWGLSLVPINGLLGKIGARLFTNSLWPRPSILIAVGVLVIVWGAGIVAAALADGSMRLPPPAMGLPPGKGLLIHYGFQVAFLSGPLVLMTTYYALAFFLQIARDIDELIVPGTSMIVVRDLFKPQIDSLLLRGRWQGMLWLLIVIGVAISFLIFRNLDHPTPYWGNDVFNARAYWSSYYVANAYLLLVWGVIYPLGVFYAVHLTLSTELVVSQLMQRGFLKLNFLHIDKCGGMARFGTINVFIMLIYVWPFCATYALHVTHKYTYLSLVVGAVASSIALILQSLYGIYWVARAIRSQREAEIADLNTRIRNAMDDDKHNFTAAVATMEYRDRVLSVSPYPYSGAALTMVNVLRFAPTVIALAKAII